MSFDCLSIKVNAVNSKFLISAFHSSPIPKKFLDIYNTNLFNKTDQSVFVTECVNMILATDYTITVYNKNIDFYDVFKTLYEHDKESTFYIADNMIKNKGISKFYNEYESKDRVKIYNNPDMKIDEKSIFIHDQSNSNSIIKFTKSINCINAPILDIHKSHINITNTKIEKPCLFLRAYGIYISEI